MQSFWSNLSKLLIIPRLSRFSSSRVHEMPSSDDNNPGRPNGIPSLLIPSRELTNTGGDNSTRRTPSSKLPLVSAALVHAREFNPSNSKESNYNHSLLTPFDYPKSQSPESPDNSHWQPRYDNMIFFDPKENSDSPRDLSDHRRKKFLTVILVNSISTPASPSTSPHKQTDISNDDIQNTYQQSLIKMKIILLQIERLGYLKGEIIEACQYARQFKGIMYGADGVISKLKTNYPESPENQIMDKFERLKLISSLFQQKCKDNQIYSGRDENSLKFQYKLSANGINNRPGLRLTYIPDKAFEMFKNHDATNAVELSATPAVAIIDTSPRRDTSRLT
jgi:hypothetical protein